MANIAFFVSNINPLIGGTERVTQSVAEGLDKIGYNSFFIYTHADNDSIINEHKLKINASDSENILSIQIRNFIQANEIKVLVVVNRVFQANKYQKVFYALKQSSNIKIIISLHAAPDNWVNKNKWGLVLPRVYIKEKIKSLIYIFYNPHIIKVVGSYKLADKYLLLSKSYIKMFEKTYHIEDSGNKLLAIPNPCPFEESYDSTLKENTVLVVSRMQEDQKRIFCILKIWEKVYVENPDWKLVIVGDGPDLDLYKNMACHLKNISFEGHSSHVQEFYRNSKLFLMTSIWEGLPMTLIEAMHYGCVPVCFDSFAALHDLIENNETGCIIPNNNLDLFVEKLKQLMGDNRMLEKMSLQILSKPNPFQIDNIIQIWDKELKKLIQ